MKAIILCYHKVGPVAEEGRRLNIEPSRLESHVRFFARRRFSFLMGRDLALSWPEKAVCFTFDDAYSSTMDNAPELLERHGGRGSFYAVSSKAGTTSDWEGDAARPLASWDVLRTVQAKGHEVGNHTATHLRLADLDPAAQIREIDAANRRMRDEAIRPGSFCYPYGSLNGSAVEAVRSAGFAVGLALGKRIATSDEDRLRLSRVVVAFSDSLPALLYRLHVRPLLRRR